MKNFIYLLSITLFLSLPSHAQNEGISFQGLARNAAGEVLVSQKISLRLSILLDSESGTAAYVETRQVTTNPQGIFAVVLGDTNALTKSTNFSTINWTAAPKFIKVEMDSNAGTNFTAMGTSKLQPVPFAYYAYGVDAENVEGILPLSSGGTGVASMTELKTSLGLDVFNNAALDTKVDKVSGKGLSTNDYTTVEKNKLEAIAGTNTGDQDLSAYATTTQLATKANASDVTASLANKVDKENGKGLSSNDYTNAEKTKLASITGINLQGLQGLPGATGPQGLQGLPGAVGATGSTGATGPAGPQGLQGPAGPRGLSGSTGAAGAQGQPGVAGPAGSDGAIGAAGPRGLQGPTGPAGSNGVSASSANFVDLTTDQTIGGIKTFSGNIGMGTSTPNAKFEIVGGTRNDMLRLVSDGNPSVSFKNTDPSGGAANDGEYQLFAAGNSGNPSIDPGTFGIYYDHTSNAGYRMAITNSGNVGIGTAKPTEKLDVVGKLKTSGTLTAGTVTYPNTHGSANQVLSTTGSGTLAWTTPSTPSGANLGDMQYWNGTSWVVLAATANEGASLQMIGGVPTWTGGTAPPPPSVTSLTGRVWMDRNLGASRVATSITDTQAYGDLYQWGRGADGHQLRSSNTTSTRSASDIPGNGNFIVSTNSPNDWRSTQNPNLWQGVNGVNNPCPSGYRLPTEAEWETERLSWTTSNSDGAFASPLKLPEAGRRNFDSGAFINTDGVYWSSTISGNGTSSQILYFYYIGHFNFSFNRAYGSSVRCIKN